MRLIFHVFVSFFSCKYKYIGHNSYQSQCENINFKNFVNFTKRIVAEKWRKIHHLHTFIVYLWAKILQLYKKKIFWQTQEIPSITWSSIRHFIYRILNTWGVEQYTIVKQIDENSLIQITKQIMISSSCTSYIHKYKIFKSFHKNKNYYWSCTKGVR